MKRNMDVFRRFYIINRTYILRNRVRQPIWQRKKLEKIKFPVTACSSSNVPLKNRDRFKSNLPVFNACQFQIKSDTVRCFCSHDTDLSKYMISTYEVRKNQISFFDMWRMGIRTMELLYFDPKFVPHEFTESAEQAARIISKLISERKLDELETLVTSECLSKLSENIDNWVEDDRRDIAIEENDYVLSAPYDCKITKEENKTSLEVSLLITIVKNVKSSEDFKEGSLGPSQELLKKHKWYCANYRFIRYYDKDRTPGDWIVNGINHFKADKEKF